MKYILAGILVVMVGALAYLVVLAAVVIFVARVLWPAIQPYLR